MKSTFDLGEITLDFLKTFQKVQYELQCENSMHTIETYSRATEFQKLQILYGQHISAQKDYFYKFYQIFQKFYFHKNFNHLNMNINPNDMIDEDHRKIPTLKEFSNYVTNVTDLEVIECLTFSTIPAYFSFFCSTFEGENLVSFFSQINKNDKTQEKKYFDIYARSIFISPFFLSFITFALQPVFSSFLLNSNLNIEQIIQKVKTDWRNKIQHLPKFVYDVIKISPNPALTLSKSFFEIVLQNINDNNSFLQVYLLIYSGQFPSKEYLHTMSLLFTYSSEINILNDLVQIMFNEYQPNIPSKIFETKEFFFEDNFFFNEKDKENAPSLFQPFLFSTVDYAVLDFISNVTDTFVMPNKFSIFSCYQEDEEIEESIHNIDELTMTNDSLQVKAALRHLLQLCDTLPVFQSVPEGLTVEDFFNTYLVTRGPIETLIKRIELAKVVQLICTFESPQKIMQHLYETVLDRTKEIRALSAFTAISDKIVKQIQAIRFSMTQTQTNYDSILIIGPKLSSLNSNSASIFSIEANFLLTSNFLPKQNSIFSENSVDKYYNHPASLIKDIENILKNITKDQAKAKKIIFARLTRNFNLNNFILSRKNLTQADTEVNNFVSNNTQYFFDKTFIIKKQPPKFDTNRWLIEQINGLKNNKFLRELLQDASEESYPLRKAAVYNFYLFNLRNCLIRKFSPEKGEIGADQFVPSEAAFYWLVNPDKIVSNYVFLHDYLFNKFCTDLIDVTDIVSILRLIINSACPHLDLESLCRFNE